MEIHQVLLDYVQECQEEGSLDHKWLIRSHLAKHAPLDDVHRALLRESAIAFVYLDQNRDRIQADRSLKAVVTACTDPDLIKDINDYDYNLYLGSRLVSELINSARSLYMCYDCGTVARSVFHNLIREYRGRFYLTKGEIKRIKSTYYMNRYTVSEGLKILSQNIHQIKQSCLFMIALQFGDKFGHIYIIDYQKDIPSYRIFQSCFNSYLLIDYIELMDYANPKIQLDINQHLQDLHTLMLSQTLDRLLFIELFRFDLPMDIDESDQRQFTSSYVVY